MRLDMKKSNMFKYQLIFDEFSITFTLIWLHSRKSEFTYGKFSNQCEVSFKQVFIWNKTLLWSKTNFSRVFGSLKLKSVHTPSLIDNVVGNKIIIYTWAYNSYNNLQWIFLSFVADYCKLVMAAVTKLEQI